MNFKAITKEILFFKFSSQDLKKKKTMKEGYYLNRQVINRIFHRSYLKEEILCMIDFFILSR